MEMDTEFLVVVGGVTMYLLIYFSVGLLLLPINVIGDDIADKNGRKEMRPLIFAWPLFLVISIIFLYIDGFNRIKTRLKTR